MKHCIKYTTILLLAGILQSCSGDSKAEENSREMNTNINLLIVLLEYIAGRPVDNCPPESEIESLTTGTYVRNLQSGQKYWFDPIIRRQGNYISTHYLQINEAVGQDVKLYKITCDSVAPVPANLKVGDSGLSGQTESILFQLFRDDRQIANFLIVESGFGDVTFTVP